VEILHMLVWPVALVVAVTVVTMAIAREVRRSSEQLSMVQVSSEEQTCLCLEGKLLELKERQQDVDFKQGTLEARIAARVAELGAQTSQYEADAETAKQSVEAAVEANAIALRGKAEAARELALEVGRADLLAGVSDRQLKQLAKTYEYYCDSVEGEDPVTFGAWLGDFRGLYPQPAE